MSDEPPDRPDYRGMTTNERLFIAGLLDAGPFMASADSQATGPLFIPHVSLAGFSLSKSAWTERYGPARSRTQSRCALTTGRLKGGHCGRLCNKVQDGLQIGRNEGDLS